MRALWLSNVGLTRGGVVDTVLVAAARRGEEQVLAAFAVKLVDGGVVEDSRGIQEVRAVQAAAAQAAQVADPSRVGGIGASPFGQEGKQGVHVGVVDRGVADKDVVAAAAAQSIGPQ